MSTSTELDAAGITDTALRASYTRCRVLNARHGQTYFLATRLLPPGRRPAVHALYGFARWADEIVDDLGDERPWPVRAGELDALERELRIGLDGGRCTHPVLIALVDTVRRHSLDPGLFTDFMASMRMDAVGAETEVREYTDRVHLMTYVYGSASVIGLEVLPVLGVAGTGPDARAHAEPYAAALGEAFQLTNFLRDVGEDLERGRVYLPADELAAFGVDRERLERCRAEGRTDPGVRAALADQVAYTRAVYRRAHPGIELLDRRSRGCVRAAYVLYSDILTEIESAGFDVLNRRVSVRGRRRAAVAAPLLVGSLAARLPRRHTVAAPAATAPSPAPAG